MEVFRRSSGKHLNDAAARVQPTPAAQEHRKERPMKHQTSIDVEIREPGSSNQAKRMRREGRLPAVLYGGDREPRPIAVDPRRVIEILRSEGGQNTILSLKVGDGREQTALIHDYQVDPISQKILHADFKRISMDVEVEVDVPVHIVGEARGVKVDHGILDQIVRTVAVRCLPGDIPDSFDVDVTELEIGSSLHVSDIAAPAGVEILDDGEQTLVVVAAPAVVEEPEGEEEDLLGIHQEPELIGHGDEGEEESE